MLFTLAYLALATASHTGAEPAQTWAPVLSTRWANRPARLPLPEGKLQPFSEADIAAHFLDLDSVQHDDGMVRLTYYTVVYPPTPSGDREISHWVTEAQVDCPGHRQQMLRLSAYDAAGDEVLWLPVDDPEAIRPGTLQANLHRAVCTVVLMDISLVATGWREALAAGRRRIQEGR